MRFIYIHARVYLYISIMFVHKFVYILDVNCLTQFETWSLSSLFNSNFLYGTYHSQPNEGRSTTLKIIKPSAIGKTLVLDPSIE